jgi:hypothetical protein
MMVLAVGALTLSSATGDSALRLRNDELTTLAGKKLSGDVSQILKGQVIYGTGGAKVDLLQLRQIRRAASPVEATRITSWVYLAGGGRIHARSVSIADGQVRIAWVHGEMRLPMKLVTGVKFSLPEGDDTFRPAFIDAVEDREAREDRLLAVRDGKLLAIGGLLVGLDRGQVTFEMDGEERTVEQSRLYGLAIANPGDGPDLNGAGLIAFTDGSLLWARINQMDGRTLNVSMLDGQTHVKLNWRDVHSILIRSDRMIYLSDMTPISVDEQPLLDRPRPWRRDRNVRGGTLTLGSQAYEKGIGVRSRSELVFEAGGDYATFAAVIGIDANTRPADRGDCEFIVLGDGKELLRQRVRRDDDPRAIAIDIRGVEQVTLLVDYGEELSFADHANWCDARFVKKAPNE